MEERLFSQGLFLQALPSLSSWPSCLGPELVLGLHWDTPVDLWAAGAELRTLREKEEEQEDLMASFEPGVWLFFLCS